MHGPGVPNEWFRLDFISEALHSLSINSEDIVCFDQPTIIPQIIIPWPSFQDQAFIYSGFADLCRDTGNRLTDNTKSIRNPRPAYLTKTGLTTSITRIANESEIVETVSAAGFEIIYPERLTLTEKVQLFRDREWITGFSSSAMHVSLFAPPDATGLLLNPFAGANSNFVMFDLANGNDFRYLYSPNSTMGRSTMDGFENDIILKDTSGICRDLLEIIEWRPSAT